MVTYFIKISYFLALVYTYSVKYFQNMHRSQYTKKKINYKIATKLLKY